jgi:hypothetical protein
MDSGPAPGVHVVCGSLEKIPAPDAAFGAERYQPLLDVIFVTAIFSLQ